MRTAAIAVLLLVTAFTLGGCAATSVPAPPGGAPTPTATVDAGGAGVEGMNRPGPFVIRYDGTELQLSPHTWCFTNGCADGVDENPPSVGSSDELLVRFDEDGFDSLVASQFSGDDDYCAGRTVEATVTDIGDGWWRVEPAGPADDYRLSLFAFGSAGDAAADVRWTVPADLPLPESTASVTVIADHDGRPDSYGVELGVQNLEVTPSDASAQITVTAANGKSHTFDARPTEECAGVGALRFAASEAEGRAAAALGGFPFTYRVELTIDGETHVGTGTYPDDAPPRELAVPLSFEPPLP
ncbi:hypothetical protein [Microbacterium sp. H1-D42]|uniref:hypothetical protein n=1 Tax=Microbacterium sp. H1-D42 TaxID=2925844 RepID=UPI001F52B73A|nr:hypothetical protein [Microbacterium sp. H1-D42]UNK71804.1 hypothetical protein MNR00_04925 [Microbacterium sp. H1-D42]